MPVLGRLLIVIGDLARFIITVLEFLIILQVVMSWIRIGLPLNRLTRLFYAITEALYRPVRAVLPVVIGGWDLTPLFALAGLYIIDRWIIGSIIQVGFQLLR